MCSHVLFTQKYFNSDLFELCLQTLTASICKCVVTTYLSRNISVIDLLLSRNISVMTYLSRNISVMTYLSRNISVMTCLSRWCWLTVERCTICSLPFIQVNFVRNYPEIAISELISIINLLLMQCLLLAMHQYQYNYSLFESYLGLVFF